MLRDNRRKSSSKHISSDQKRTSCGLSGRVPGGYDYSKNLILVYVSVGSLFNSATLYAFKCSLRALGCCLEIEKGSG